MWFWSCSLGNNSGTANLHLLMKRSQLLMIDKNRTMESYCMNIHKYNAQAPIPKKLFKKNIDISLYCSVKKWVVQY